MKLPRPLAAALLALSTLAAAQAWPTQPLRLVVPFPAGGGTDALARSITDRLGARLGQSVLIENRAGASGNIGSDYVARAAPDGYTLLLHVTMMSTYKLTFPKLPYDALADLNCVGTVADSPNVLVVPAASGVRNLQDMVAAARARPGGLNYGTAGLGSPQHLATEQLARLGGFRLQHVAYKGVAPAVTDVMGGQIDMAAISLAGVLPMLEGRRVRAVTLLSARRTPLAPDIPTAAEGGIPGLDSTVRFVLMVPSRTPPAIVARLNAELNATLADPAVQQGLARVGYEALQSTPEQAQAMLRRELEIWSPIIKTLDLETR